MKTKLDVDTERIANYCGVSAKNSHGKISSYHLTLRKPFVEALGIAPGDSVDVAILQVNKGLPQTTPPTSELKPGPDVFTPAQEENPAPPGSAVDGTETIHEHAVRVKAARKKGEKGKSRRGKGGTQKSGRRRK